MAGGYRAQERVTGRGVVELKVRGARENNLRELSLNLPLGRLVVFAGVSGSGKSSLAFDTIHAEGRRRYLEASSVGRGGDLSLSAPKVDAVDGLPPTIALAQRTSDPEVGSTTASLAGAVDGLRLLFGRAGTLHCPRCDRAIEPVTHDQIVQRLLALPSGSRVLVEAPLRRGEGSVASALEAVERAGFSRVRVNGEVQRLDSLVRSRVADDAELAVVVDRVKVDPSRASRLYDAVRTASRAGRGEVSLRGDITLDFVDRPYCAHDDLELPSLEPRLLDRRSAVGRCVTCAGRGEDEGARCGDCAGSGLGPVARAVRFAGLRFAEVLNDTVSEAVVRGEQLPRDPVSERPLAAWTERVRRLDQLGLGALALDRPGALLSAGEVQRLRLARMLGGGLSGVLYVLDEPAAGLGDAAAQAVVEAIRELVDQGNSVLAVEHHPVVLRAADHLVEFGPGAGEQGGQVVFHGTLDELAAADTLTAQWLDGRRVLSAVPARPSTGELAVDTPYGPLALPLGTLVALHGPSGSGKSRRLDAAGAVANVEDGGPFERVIRVHDSSVGRSARSNVATWTGLWTLLRNLLAETAEAKIRGLSAGQFSLNVSGGRCEACKGTGVQVVDLHWLADVHQTCEVCGGRRFVGDVLEVRWKGLAADELLALSAADARALLSGHPDLEARLRALVDVGLGYMPLGQPGHTWSGGEARRLLFARELARAYRRGADSTVFLLDDPTVGLHPEDTAHLLDLLRQLVDQGATVWLATHDDALAAACAVQLACGGPT